MKILPAIDILNGEAVRLYKGDFEQKTVYCNEPLDVAKRFEGEGSQYLHIVDLNGAKGEKRQLEIIEGLVTGTSLKVQVGGGIKSLRDVEDLLRVGVDRVIIGSLAVKNKKLVKSIIEAVGGGRITIALDVEKVEGQFEVAINGWQKGSGISIEESIADYSVYDAIEFLITDISKDGTLLGPNFDLYNFA